jgi:ADP-heptose:LPS heptosyltransferase
MAEDTLLVISEMGLGDALTLLPALRALKSVRPALSIELIAPGLRALAGNVADTAAWIDHRPLAGLPASGLREWLEARGPSWIWNTENEHSPWRPVLEAAANPRWVSAPPHRAWPRRPVLRLRAEQLRRLFPETPEPGAPFLGLTPEQAERRAGFAARFASASGLAALHPGAKDKTKAWPAEKFIRLALRLAREDGTAVCLFLGPDEAAAVDPIWPVHPLLVRVAEPLGGALPKLAACRVFAGNDSGFYHLAVALGLKAAAVYRSTRNRAVWSFPSARTRAVCVWLPSPIRRHWKRLVPVGRVLRAVRALDPSRP